MLISIDQYRAQCKEFFELKENTQSAIIAQMSGLGVQDVRAWQNALIERYDQATNSLILELVAQINLDDESEKTREQRRIVRMYREIKDEVCQVRIFDLQAVKDKLAQVQAWDAEENRKRSLQVNVDGRAFTAERVIDVLWCGWECDAQAWLVRDAGVARVVTSDHGAKQFSDRAFLQERITAYKDAIAQTQEMLDELV